MHAYLARLIDDATGQLILDLSAVTFLDARGLSALIAIKGHANTAMIPLRLAALPPLVQRLLRLTRLESSFTIVEGPGPPTGRLNVAAYDEAEVSSSATTASWLITWRATADSRWLWLRA
ncbi:STAS domain-containing protein [Streptosporangium amethystogenes]|uniref:STAS domain-containing protein n=1 Tax=Streptosporangium amethystogenes TaxID=2002 RepID=UPI003CCC2D5E